MEKEILVYSEDGLSIVGCDSEYNSKIVIPQGVERIAQGAFQNSKLTEVVLPDSLKRIGAEAFKGCHSLVKVELNEGLKNIGYSAFEGCFALLAIDLPSTIRHLESYCFKDTNLQYIYIPPTLTDFGHGLSAFAYTNTYFEVDEENPNFSSENGCLYDKSKQTLIKYFCFQKYCLIDKPMTLRAIGKNAFSGCHIMQSIEFTDSIEEIESSALWGCQNLERIVLPPNLRKFGGAANCPKLKEIKLPSILSYFSC